MCISVGRPKYAKVMAGGLEGTAFIGPTAEVGQTLLLLLLLLLLISRSIEVF